MPEYLFKKVAGQACNFIKKGTLAQVFPVNFEKFLRIPFLTEHLCWLLLLFFVKLQRKFAISEIIHRLSAIIIICAE